MARFGIEEMRSCMLEALRQTPQTQDVLLRRQVAAVAFNRGLIQDRSNSGGYRSDPELPRNLWPYYRDVLWGLIVEGILAFGSNAENEKWPWLGVTDYGQRCLKENEILPHDPDGYLQQLEQIRSLDATEKRFIPQALEAFLRNLPDASAVMLGCASEHLLIILALELAKKDPSGPAIWEKRSEGKALTLLRQLDQEMQQRALQITWPRSLKEQSANTFSGIAQIIRIARNDAGHPALQRPVSRDECFVNLRLFYHYRLWIAEAIRNL